MIIDKIKRSLDRPTTSAIPEHEVNIRVLGDYSPNTIRAVAGVPLRIVFQREESAPCSEQVIFPAFGKSATLPRGKKIAIDLLPEEPGEYEFTCAMGMLRGKLVVVPGGELAA